MVIFSATWWSRITTSALPLIALMVLPSPISRLSRTRAFFRLMLISRISQRRLQMAVSLRQTLMMEPSASQVLVTSEADTSCQRFWDLKVLLLRLAKPIGSLRSSMMTRPQMVWELRKQTLLTSVSVPIIEWLMARHAQSSELAWSNLLRTPTWCS